MSDIKRASSILTSILIDYTINSGLAEMGFILELKDRLWKLTVARDLGIIKPCHYAVAKNEINFTIKALIKNLESRSAKT